MSWFQILLNVVVIAIIVCPAKYDPAIRWKERNERKRESRQAEEFEARHDVSTLNDCDTLDELKNWIKGNLIK